MREIKFRAKSIHGGFVYGNYIYSSVFSNTNNYYKHLIITKEGNISEIEINTLGQYTGLKDKNRKEIYEGDIVTDGNTIDGGSNGEVMMYHGEWIFRWERNECIHQVEQKYMIKIHHTGLWQWDGQLIIIGNIYENPELFNN